MVDSTEAESNTRLESIKIQHARMDAIRLSRKQQLETLNAKLAEIDAQLAISGRVSEALESLSDQLFRETLSTIEDKLSIALQEILEQRLRLVAVPAWKNNAAAVDFFVQRDGFNEDILKGQGGSVANILSIGLRMFALATLDPDLHRPFLVFDEQDCWLKPELVPRLVKIIREASDAIGFQVMLISHHDREIFDEYADRIYRIRSGPNGAEAQLIASGLEDENDDR